ncbi:MAG: heat-inducible transcriptional repressor HrcA [Bacilli bacterium]|jgi:heat-inducible transcriptional repressor|nr:heat-inducible transcriptional repressor HrcA [Bacilli bacterium]
MLTSRQIAILKAIIDDFISNAIPIGSKTLQTNYQLPYSSATIRNEMASLEEMGLLVKTHTSSGRIPSSKGYRYYVDYFIDDNYGEEIEKEIEQLFENKKLGINDVIKESCDLISQMTNYTSIALGSDATDEILVKMELLPLASNSLVIVIVTNTGKVESKIFNIEKEIALTDLQKCSLIINQLLIGHKLSEINNLIETKVKVILAQELANYEELLSAFFNAFIKFTSENIYVSGRNNVINLSDFNDIDKIRGLLNIMDNHDFFEMLSKNSNELTVKIGNENEIITSDDISIVTSKYQVNENETGVIAIIGPTRMDYNRVIHLVNYVAKRINQLNIKSRGENSE